MRVAFVANQSRAEPAAIAHSESHAMPITKNQQLADGLAEKAREHINQALAADRQQQGQKYGEGLTETERARELGVDFGYSGYPTEYSWPRT